MSTTGVTPTADASKQDSLDTTSPYYLHPSDHTGLKLIPVVLKDDNYQEWVQALRNAFNAFIARRKLPFIDGRIIQPSDTDPRYDDWCSVNAMMVGWILQSVDSSIRSSLTYCDSVKDLWDEIQQRFSIGNAPRVHQLRTEIARCRQDGQSVAVYFGRLKHLSEELQTYLKPRCCTCKGCKCAWVSDLQAEREEETVHNFLMGLDDNLYGTVRSNILAQDPLPRLNRVYSLIVQEERHKMIANERAPTQDVVAFAAQSKSSPVRSSPAVRSESSTRVEKSSCTHCGRVGHDVSSCFKLHGYPEWWEEFRQKRGDGQSSSNGLGRRRGNTSRSTTLHRGVPGFANAAQGAGSSVAPITSQDRATLSPNLTDDQWTTMLDMIKKFKGPADDKLMGKPSGNWILDTGASYHMTGDSSLLQNLHSVSPSIITLPDGSTSVASQAGTVILGHGLHISNVLLVPNFTCNLISLVHLIRELQLLVTLTDRLCVIQDRTTRMVIGVGEARDGVFWFCTGIDGVKRVAAASTSTLELWHQRLGHPSYSLVSHLPGVHGNNKRVADPCSICLQSKQTRDCFPLSSNKAVDLFELIHADVWGPYRIPSSCGARYFLTLVDDYSRCVWVHLMATKTEVVQLVKKFCAFTQKQFNKPVRRFRADNGSEFYPLQPYFDTTGVIFETSCVATPQQNGRAERKHRHLLNVARALRFQASLPIRFWGQCVLTAAYLINRTPSTVLFGKTPYDLIFGKAPSYDHLRIFGSLCYAATIPRDNNKFASRSRRCVFFGYSYGKKAWRLFDLDSEAFFDSRDVVFHEGVFPFAKPTSSVFLDSELSVTHPAIYDTHDIPKVETVDPVPSSDSSTSTEPPQPVLRRSNRPSKPPTHLRDYVCHTIQCKPPPFAQMPISSPSSGTRYPIVNFVNCDKFSASHVQFLAAITTSVEPTTYNEAVRYPEWQAAMSNELAALNKNGTWSLETLPPNKTSIGCKWVFRIKYKSDGSIERHKARLVALGNRQVEGIHFHETFAPVAKMSSVRLFLSVAAIKEWELHQMDVHNAFLHGDLMEEVYMRPPPGFTAPIGKVCRLRKSLYGLRQAPRNWFAKLASALVQYGFTRSYADYSLFSYIHHNINIHVLVYVDDLIIAGNNSLSITQFKEYLHSCFHMKDLGILKYFLGIEIAHGKEGLFLCQRKYAIDILSEAGLLGAKPTEFPLSQNHGLATATGSDYPHPDRYRRLVGRLIYLTITRPELSYSVHILSQFMQTPKEAHWHAAIRVLHYIKNHPGQGIVLSRRSSLQLIAYCDSDWAACPLTRRSLTGYFILLGDSPVSWKTKKQPTVSRSSAEAEYRSMAAACCELIWLKAFLLSLGICHTSPMRLICDSQAALHISANPVFHERTKHIEIDCHFVRDLIQSSWVTTSHVRSQDQLADMFTKALGKQPFTYLLGKLGIRDLHAPT
ncbi:unnamed protein product [Rhodiola kirilowii]